MHTDEDKTFYTVTMAKVYADQGRYAEAARIYRYLLDQTPDRLDLKNALDAVSASLPEAPRDWQAIAGSVEQWVRMLCAHKAFSQLQRAARITVRRKE